MNKAQRMMNSFRAEQGDVVELLAYHQFQIREGQVRLAVMSVASFFYQKVMIPAADHANEIGSVVCAIAMVHLVWGMIFGF